MESQIVVSARKLSKHFRSVEALSDFDLQISQGEVVGLLGPNGAGKSTFVRLLMGYLTPTSGEAHVLGLNCARESLKVHQQVAYLPGDARLFRTMRGVDVLRFFAAIRGQTDVSRAPRIAERLELDLSRWVAFMSTGMRQKLALTVVLALDVPVLILDEPTANLDPSVRQEVLNLVKQARDDGRTVIFSSHVLSEIEDVCSRVVILKSGRLALEQNLGDREDRHQIQVSFSGVLPAIPPSVQSQITSVDALPRIEGDDQIQTIRFQVSGGLPNVLSWLGELPVVDIRIQPEDLQTVYDQVHRVKQ